MVLTEYDHSVGQMEALSDCLGLWEKASCQGSHWGPMTKLAGKLEWVLKEYKMLMEL